MFVPFYEPLTSIGRGEKGAASARTTTACSSSSAASSRCRSARPARSTSIGGDTRKLLTEAGEEQRRQPLTLLAYVAANCHTALAQMPEVDPARIGIIGLSYGGKWSMFASCLDDSSPAPSGPIRASSSTRRTQRQLLGAVVPRLRLRRQQRKPGVPSEKNPRTGLYKELIDAGEDLVDLHALMAPRPVLVSGGAEDPPRNWQALNHLVAVNDVLGHKNRVAMTARKTHVPTAEALELELAFLEYWLKHGDLKAGDRKTSAPERPAKP